VHFGSTQLTVTWVGACRLSRSTITCKARDRLSRDKCKHVDWIWLGLKHEVSAYKHVIGVRPVIWLSDMLENTLTWVMIWV